MSLLPEGSLYVLLAEIGKGADVAGRLDEGLWRLEPPDAGKDVGAGVGV